MNYKDYKEAMAIARQEDADRRYEKGVKAIDWAIVSRKTQVHSITTADNVVLERGDEAFNYYDMKPGIIGEIDYYAQPNTMAGQDSSAPISEWNNYWFRFLHKDGSSTNLDGSRICTMDHAYNKGWVK